MPEDQQQTRVLTAGERLAGVTFNPSGREDVNEVKETFAILFDQVLDLRNNKENDHITNIVHGNTIQTLIAAQMAVVKSLTWK